MNKNPDNISTEMKDLRIKTSSEEGSVRFKKNMLGGIREKEVEEHIASITRQFSRAEEAYKDRIDEYATHTEMLKKECDDTLEQLQKKADEIQDLKKETAALKSENARIAKDLDEYKEQLLALQNEKPGEDETVSLDRDLFKENGLLKEELTLLQQEREQAAGENAVFRKQLRAMEEQLDIIQKERDALQESHAVQRSISRQTDMKKGLIVREYTEKQTFAVKQATLKLTEILSTMEEMKDDFDELLEGLTLQPDSPTVP